MSTEPQRSESGHEQNRHEQVPRKGERIELVLPRLGLLGLRVGRVADLALGALSAVEDEFVVCIEMGTRTLPVMLGTAILQGISGGFGSNRSGSQPFN
jgi:hypothetical protein